MTKKELERVLVQGPPMKQEPNYISLLSSEKKAVLRSAFPQWKGLSINISSSPGFAVALYVLVYHRGWMPTLSGHLRFDWVDDPDRGPAEWCLEFVPDVSPHNSRELRWEGEWAKKPMNPIMALHNALYESRVNSHYLPKD